MGSVPEHPGQGSVANGQPGHHDASTCPGCEHEFEAALQASQASAQEEEERRRRQLEEEEAHMRAVRESEEEETSRRQAEEEAMMQQVMEASRRDEEAAQIKRIEQNRYEEEQRRRMLEESRQEAIRREQEERRQEEQLLEASRREAEASEMRRKERARIAHEQEQAVLAESRRQMEEEWRRREEAERAMSAFAAQYNNGSGSGNGAASSSGELNETAFWQSQIGEDKFRKLTLADQADEAAPSSSRQRQRRALPPTPGMAAQAAGLEPARRPSATAHAHLPHRNVDGSGHSHARIDDANALDHDDYYDEEYDDDDGDDPFADSAEAPPTYEEAGVDRPPAAPDTIPDHVRFDPPPQTAQNNASSSDPRQYFPPEKTAGQPVSSPSSVPPLTPSASDGQGTSAMTAGTADSSTAFAAGSSAHSPVVPNSADTLQRRNSPRGSLPRPPIPPKPAFIKRVSSSNSESIDPLQIRPSTSSPSPNCDLAVANKVQEASAREDSDVSPQNTSPDGQISPALSIQVQDRTSSLGKNRQRPDSADSAESGEGVTQEKRQSVSSSVPESSMASDSRSSIGSSSAPTTILELQQTAMKGTDFGYCAEPFAPDLFAPLPESGALSDSSEAKERFPNVIQLARTPSDGSGLLNGTAKNAFFVIRAPSWKSLLRAMAWYGNTRVEAGPEEVADGQKLRINAEVEFVTPSTGKTDYFLTGYYAPSTAGSNAASRAAHVAVCFSLALKPTPTMTGIIKSQSRGLDSTYLRRGSARRVIHVPRQSPTLPVGMVKLAQHLHAAHTLSAACPSSGSTALHSPRDLHHAVERHDIGFVAKARKAAAKNRPQPAAPAATNYGAIGANGGNVTAPNGASASKGGEDAASTEDSNTRPTSRLFAPNMGMTSGARRDGTGAAGSGAGAANGNGGGADEGDLDPDDIDADGVEFFAGGVGEDQAERSGFGRMRDRVRRRLGKRAGDGNVVDEDLESWISEYIPK